MHISRHIGFKEAKIFTGIRFGTQESDQRSKHRQKDEAKAKSEDQNMVKHWKGYQEKKCWNACYEETKMNCKEDRENADHIHKEGVDNKAQV